MIEPIGGAPSGTILQLWPPEFSDADLVARGLASHAYIHAALQASPGNAAIVINQLQFIAFPVQRNGLINFLACRLAANGGAGAVLRFGIYDSDPISNLPRNLLFDSGQFAADVGAPVNLTAAPSITVVRGTLLWLAYLAGVGVPAPSVSIANIIALAENGAGTILTPAFFVSQAYGALPATIPTPGWATSTGAANVKVGFA